VAYRRDPGLFGSGLEHDEAPPVSENREAAEDARSLTEPFEQLGRDLSELGMSETQLEAARNMPEVRRAGRDIVGAPSR
jgi:hypothetical protein